MKRIITFIFLLAGLSLVAQNKADVKTQPDPRSTNVSTQSGNVENPKDQRTPSNSIQTQTSQQIGRAHV